jgi:hypothetical protein|tara:strand:- start:1701 stop:1823 length:123 start_codon:yes stop_codon:yes gene_type:complete
MNNTVFCRTGLRPPHLADADMNNIVFAEPAYAHLIRLTLT